METAGREIQGLGQKRGNVFHVPKLIQPMPWVTNCRVLGRVYAVIRLVCWIGASVGLKPPHWLSLQLFSGFISLSGGSLVRLILLKGKHAHHYFSLARLDIFFF